MFRLREPEGMGRHPAWTPDGQYILFWKRFGVDKQNPTREAELWRIPSEGGEPRKTQLTAEYPFFASISVHPDGRRIAYSAGNSHFEIWVLKNLLPKPSASN